MNALLAAIYDLFDEDTDLYGALSGRLYYDRAPYSSEMPYGVYRLTTSVATDSFDVAMSNVGVQFSFFAADLSTVNDAIKQCRALYDGAYLSTGARLCRELIIPARHSGDDQEDGWQADIEFLTYAKEE